MRDSLNYEGSEQEDYRVEVCPKGKYMLNQEDITSRGAGRQTWFHLDGARLLLLAHSLHATLRYANCLQAAAA